MNYVDEEKRSQNIGHIIKHVNSLDTLKKLDDFIDTISPDKLKAILKKGYQDSKIQSDVIITLEEEKKIKDLDMISKL